MSLYLARADREVVALDLSREALKLGADAARRYGIERVTFVEADLTRLPLKPGAFDLVYSLGRAPPHARSRAPPSRRIAAAVKPGGAIVIGLYNTHRPRCRSGCGAASPG